MTTFHKILQLQILKCHLFCLRNDDWHPPIFLFQTWLVWNNFSQLKKNLFKLELNQIKSKWFPWLFNLYLFLHWNSPFQQLFTHSSVANFLLDNTLIFTQIIVDTFSIKLSNGLLPFANVTHIKWMKIRIVNISTNATRVSPSWD